MSEWWLQRFKRDVAKGEGTPGVMVSVRVLDAEAVVAELDRLAAVKPPIAVETLQRFLADGRDAAWAAVPGQVRSLDDWVKLAHALDATIVQALDNETGWTCNEFPDDDVAALKAKLARAAYVAEGLFSMIDRETWRSTGGDDGQGHYEGDYRAEQLAAEIAGWKT